MQSDIDSEVSNFFAFKDIGSLISSMVDAVIVVGALASLIYLTQAGLHWVTAGNDPKKVDDAQKQITNAIIGLILIVASWAIFLVLKSFLGLDDAITTN